MKAYTVRRDDDVEVAAENDLDRATHHAEMFRLAHPDRHFTVYRCDLVFSTKRLSHRA